MTDTPVTYGLVEAALVKTYRVPAKAVGAFRGRLGNLQKQGLFGKASMPGKGVALHYSKDQIHRLIFACECFEFGLSPSVVLTMVKSLWDSKLREVFHHAEEAEIILLVHDVSLMTSGWSNQMPIIEGEDVRNIDFIQRWLTDVPGAARMLLVNLSQQLRTFYNQLGKVIVAKLPQNTDKNGKAEPKRKTKVRSANRRKSSKLA
jgi:hypothetical protein